MAELASCPGCGKSTGDLERVLLQYHFVCENPRCGWIGPDGDTPEDAARLWNTRTPPDRNELFAVVGDVIGEGVHAGLRKYTESDHAMRAWRAIRQMPHGEWTAVIDVVTEEVLKVIAADNNGADDEQ